MEDAVRPDERTFRAMYERGFRTWATLHETVKRDAHSGKNCVSCLQYSFPRHPYFPKNLVVDARFTNTVCVTGKATWTTGGEPQDLAPFHHDAVWQVAAMQPVQIVITADISPSETILPGLLGKDGDSNHVPILILAWAYIFSARWAELITGASIGYTSVDATGCSSRGTEKPPDGQPPVVVDVGDASDDAFRWWSAVLGVDGGWRAIIHNARETLLYSPWSTTVGCKGPFVISAASIPRRCDYRNESVPCSTAMRYLLDYCNLHDLAEQSQAALAAAMLIPLARLDSINIQLPPPQLPSRASSRQRSGRRPPDPSEAQLDRLLTLSCNCRGVSALLSSVFFEPDVESNICGAWLQGSFAFLNSVDVSNSLLWTLINREPDLGMLWVGAFITRSYARCLREAQAAWWKAELNAAAWTGTHVSFIQQPVARLTPEMSNITRADECRLLYLSQGMSHTTPPLLAFPPFGSTATGDTNLDVRLHAGCSSHVLTYRGFAWRCEGADEVQQGKCEAPADGVRMRPPSTWDDTMAVDYSELDWEEDDSSEMVTRNVFTWLRGEDGFPVAERATREHEWIDNLESDDDGGSVEGSCQSSAWGDLHGWRLRTCTHGAESV